MNDSLHILSGTVTAVRFSDLEVGLMIEVIGEVLPTREVSERGAWKAGAGGEAGGGLGVWAQAARSCRVLFALAGTARVQQHVQSRRSECKKRVNNRTHFLADAIIGEKKLTN